MPLFAEGMMDPNPQGVTHLHYIMQGAVTPYGGSSAYIAAQLAGSHKTLGCHNTQLRTSGLVCMDKQLLCLPCVL